MADTRTDAEIQASLQRPGAGVPPHHKFLMRYIVRPLVAGKSNWDKDSETFGRVAGRIIKDYESLSEAQRTKRVLVPPQFGLEDSSRYWSAAMLLEHMLIVTQGIASLVVPLSKGIVPDYEVEMARVKPQGEMTAQDALTKFRAYSATAMAELDKSVGDRNAKAALLHPWFGPFTARQWHWLMTAHAVIHLNQLRAICWRLNPPKMHPK